MDGGEELAAGGGANGAHGEPEPTPEQPELEPSVPAECVDTLPIECQPPPCGSVISGAPVSYITAPAAVDGAGVKSDSELAAAATVSTVFEAGRTPVEEIDHDELINRQWAHVPEAHESPEQHGDGTGAQPPADAAHSADSAAGAALSPSAKRAKKDLDADPCKPQPSRVVHVRNMHFKATDADLVDALSHFGDVAYTTIMPRKRMALVEFEQLCGAQACIDYAATGHIYVAGQPALFNYSTSRFVQRLGFESEEPNHVIVVAVYNVQYPINVDVIYQVCKVYGAVRRIAMIRRSQLQALVEFDSVHSATGAKKAMNGADIYTGCCSLKVEFAKVESVKVFRNDKDQWDFTVPPESLVPADVKESYMQQRRTLLPAATGAAGGGTQQQAGGWQRPVPQQQQQQHAAPTGNSYGVNAMSVPPPTAVYSGGQSAAYRQRPAGNNAQPPPNLSGPTTARDRSLALSAGYSLYDGGGGVDADTAPNYPQSSNVALSGLDWLLFNCDMVFNIMCLFGNCDRIKFVRTPDASAPGGSVLWVGVQMGAPREVRNAIDMLHGAIVFGRAICVKPLADPIRRPDASDASVVLSDGSALYKEYVGVRSQRFSTPQSAARNRVIRPTNVLHWYNAPPDTDSASLQRVFASCSSAQRDCPVPTAVVIFAGKSERSTSGICEFDTVQRATDALVTCNHTPIDSHASPVPYILKLAFGSVNPRRADGTAATGTGCGTEHSGSSGTLSTV